MAAMFGLPVTPTSESIQVSHCVAEPQKYIDASREIGYTKLELWHRHPIYIRREYRHFEFCGRDLKYFDTRDIRKNVLVIPYQLMKTAWKNSNKFRRYRGVQLLQPRHIRNQKTSHNPRVN